MLLGWGITSLSMFVLLAFSDLSFDAMDVMLEQQGVVDNDNVGLGLATFQYQFRQLEYNHDYLDR
jgi:hypothetical protein